MSGGERIPHDCRADIGVEITVVKGDPGVASFAETLDHVGLSVAVGIAKSDESGGNGCNRAATRCLEVDEEIAIGRDRHVSSGANAVSENRCAEAGRKPKACVVSRARRRVDDNVGALRGRPGVSGLGSSARSKSDEDERIQTAEVHVSRSVG